MDGSLILILHAHLPYVLHHGKWPHGSDWLCEAAAECYIPILNECYRLMDEGIAPKLTMSFSPVLVEQLLDPDFPEVFNEYLDEKIAAAVSDAEYFAGRPQDRHYIVMAEFWRTWYVARKRDFNDRYKGNLPDAFRDLQDQDAVALQTCAATHGYLPLLGRDRSVELQVELAAKAHGNYFGRSPRGIWMPECAYRPCYYWQAPVEPEFAVQGVRKGIEQVIAENDLEYTIIDAHQTRGGKPLGVRSYTGRFTARSAAETTGYDEAESLRELKQMLPLDDSRSIYELYDICSTGDPDAGVAAIFTRDTDTTFTVWSGDHGFPGAPEYLEFHKKHHNSGLRYWRVTAQKSDLADKRPYEPKRIAAVIRDHAAQFVALIEKRMSEFSRTTGRAGTLSAPFDAELFGHWWFEGPRFLGEVMRQLAQSERVRAHTAPEELDARNPNLVIQIFEGSWGDGGDHRVWNNPETEWTWGKIYRTENAFYDLLDHCDPYDELEVRLLKQMAREMLLLQASDWQFLITTMSAADYATTRFGEHYAAGVFLAGCARALLDGMPMLTVEQLDELERLEQVDRIFPKLELDDLLANPDRIPKLEEETLAT